MRREAQCLKDGRSPGVDRLPSELWKGWSNKGYDLLAAMFDEVLRGVKKMPDTWKDQKSNGSLRIMGNHR